MLQIPIGLWVTQVLQPSRLHGEDQCHEYHPGNHEKYLSSHLVKDQRLSKYFSSFPFTSYILTYCCEIRDRIQKFNSHLLEVSHKMETSSSPRALKNNHKAVMKMYSIDLADYISYLDDLMSFGSEDLAFFIRNAILCYIVLPNLRNIHLDLPRILVKSSIYLMFYLFKLINDNKFKETLCLLMLGKQIPKIYAERL